MTDTALIVFTPSGKRGRFPLGTPCCRLPRSLGSIWIRSVADEASAGAVRSHLGEGEFAKHGIVSKAGHASMRGAVEERYNDRKGLKTDRRLGCQAQILDDLVVDVPAESQVHRQLVRKRAEVRDIELDPVITLHYVEVDQPDMHAQASDLQRLERALAVQWQLKGLSADLRVIQSLQKTLREAKWGVNRRPSMPASGSSLVWPGLQERVYGVAFECRLDHHRRSPDRAAHRRGDGLPPG